MEKKSRIIIDFPDEEHQYLKLLCDKLGISMEEFMIKATIEKMEGIEDEVLSLEVKEMLARIEDGKEELVDWEDYKNNEIDTENKEDI